MRTFSSLLLLAAIAVAVCSADAPRFRMAQRQHFGQFARQELAPDAAFDTTTAEGPYPPAGSQRPGREFPLPSETEAPFNGDGEDSDDSDDNELTTTAATATTDGPYAPSGWQPAGRLLALPAFQRQHQQPSQLYGAPSHEYGAPETTTDFSEFGETEASAAAETNETTDEPESELLPGSAQLNNQNSFGSSAAKVEKLQKQQQQQSQLVTPATYFVQLPSGQLQQIAAPAGAVSSAAYYQLPGAPTVNAGLLSAQLQQQHAAVVYPSASRYVVAAAQTQPQFVQFGQLVASPQAVSYSSQYRAEQSW